MRSNNFPDIGEILVDANYLMNSQMTCRQELIINSTGHYYLQHVLLLYLLFYPFYIGKRVCSNFNDGLLHLNGKLKSGNICSSNSVVANVMRLAFSTFPIRVSFNNI